jgi:hypothetical protein
MVRLSLVIKMGGVFYKVNKRVKKVNLLVIRIDKNNKLQMAKPCLQCLTTIKKMNIIKNIYYSTGNGDEIKCEKITEIENIHVSRGNRSARYNNLLKIR